MEGQIMRMLSTNMGVIDGSLEATQHDRGNVDG